MAPENSEVSFLIPVHSKDLQNQCSGRFAVILLNEILVVFVGFTFEFLAELTMVAVGLPSEFGKVELEGALRGSSPKLTDVVNPFGDQWWMYVQFCATGCFVHQVVADQD